jgi:hypothetical protein
MYQRSSRHAFFQASQHQVSGVYDYVNADLMENGFVLWVFDQGHSSWHLENMLGHLGDDKIGGVVPG